MHQNGGEITIRLTRSEALFPCYAAAVLRIKAESCNYDAPKYQYGDKDDMRHMELGYY